MDANLATPDSAWERTPCPACGDPNFRHHRTLESICSELLFRKPVQEVHLVECNACGLIYVNPRPVPEIHQRLFTKEAFFGASFQDYLSREQVIRSEAQGRLASISRIMRPGRLLDVGCCLGFFLDEARKQGWSVRGVEISADFVEFARQTFQLDVLNIPAERLDLPANSADLITFWGIIEYTYHPRLVFEAVHRILAPEGVVFFSVANIRSLDYWMLGGRWPWLYPPAHLVHFSRRPLTRMLHQTGFRLLRLWSEPGPDDLFSAAAKAMVSRAVCSPGGNFPAHGWASPFSRWVKQGLKFSYRTLSSLFCSMGAGSKLVVIAQKKGNTGTGTFFRP